MKRNRLVTLIVIGGLAAIAAGTFAGSSMLRASSGSAEFQAVDVTGVPWGHDFRLMDYQGKERRLADFRGKVVLLTFGYTSCPDMCPMTLTALGAAMKEMGRDADKVQGLFVTVDAKRDTPQVLAQYVPAFYPTFLGLRADEATTEKTVGEFKVYFHANSPNAEGFYTVDHSGQVFAFDPAGRIRLLIRPDRLTPESIAHDLRLLLREGAG